MTAKQQDSLGARKTLDTARGAVSIFSLPHLEARGMGAVSRLPFAVRVLLENLLRCCGRGGVGEEDVAALAAWTPGRAGTREVPFHPSRIVLQDFTGVPAVADLAGMRDAVARHGGDPGQVHPVVPADLVIDHSVQVDVFGRGDAKDQNVRREFERNGERYAFLRWAQASFHNLRVVPPGTGIVHQVNLERLSPVVHRREVDGRVQAFPDTLLGTDSHTTMINGLGVLGWGVGGIEAEAVLLGEPYRMKTPRVVGMRLEGELPEGVTATDLVLTVTEALRRKGVVETIVEFTGKGLANLSLADRATLANMAPEYGATTGFFPVDGETLAYLRATGRDAETIDLVERYTKEQGLFRGDGDPEPVFSDTLALDLSSVEPSLAGPRRPQDRVTIPGLGASFQEAVATARGAGAGETVAGKPSAAGPAAEKHGGNDVAAEDVRDGAVVIAAITSCTNTSNPSVMLAAGLLSRNAAARGLRPKPWVKTSLAPGSRVVPAYLERAGLLEPLQAVGFHVVGFGCTTCIGNSGPLPDPVAKAVRENDLVVAAVLSGNRNFEGRVHPLVRANYLASPPLVVAYALAGTVAINLHEEPLGKGTDGKPVYLRDVWPASGEIRAAVSRALDPAVFRERYASVFEGSEDWRALAVPEGNRYAWDPASTYIASPPFYDALETEGDALGEIRGARVLAMLGDSVTTDHISPAGAIAADGPAGRYLLDRGVSPEAFNTYGSRRGNHEVMMRGTFANVRLRNQLAPGTEGGWTAYQPGGEKMSIFDASVRYREAGIPLLVLAGKEYGTGSSRDWAAKGPYLLGVRAVIARSFERIHRSNLIGMGILPLEFPEGSSRESLGLTGQEAYTIEGLDTLEPRGTVRVVAVAPGGKTSAFEARARVDQPAELETVRFGGILPAVCRRILSGG